MPESEGEQARDESETSSAGGNEAELTTLGIEVSSALRGKLGQWSATAICGNDITSSCLYVAAICILAAGHLAPISLLVVVVVLYLYRKIYAEVGGALPLNGGAYNCLLNTTSKFRASIAACMTSTRPSPSWPWGSSRPRR
jgi:hypothetical protein